MEVHEKFINTLIITLFLFITVQAQLREHYEDASQVCHEKCVCQNQNDSLLLNCTNRNMNFVLNTWPPHKNYLTASFNYNNISELEQLPQSDAKYISISFAHCGIKTLASALFIDATGIQLLDLSWNLLTGREIHGDVFRGRYSNSQNEPISLSSLDLSFNHIESIPHSAFEHTPHLQRLYLSGNPLRVLDPQTSHAISSVLSLEVLHLANTSLKTMPADVFSRLRKLKELDLSENRLEKVPETVAHLSASLQKMNLGGNLMKSLQDDDLMGLHELKHLNISGLTELRTIHHNSFAYLPKLQVLHCENNRKLYHIHEHAFGINAHIPSLSELYLSNNDLETISPFLVHWSTLSVLSLAGNRWHCDCQLFSTITAIQNLTSGIISSEATCSSPSAASGTALGDLEGLETICANSFEDEDDVMPGRGVHGVLMKGVLVIGVVLLTLVACFVFWKVIVRYNNIRSINTMFPVMYVSAPTSED